VDKHETSYYRPMSDNEADDQRNANDDDDSANSKTDVDNCQQTAHTMHILLLQIPTLDTYRASQILTPFRPETFLSLPPARDG